MDILRLCIQRFAHKSIEIPSSFISRGSLSTCDTGMPDSNVSRNGPWEKGGSEVERYVKK